MSPVRKGPVSQRQLVVEMKLLIDAAMAGNSSAHKDIARSKLRALLDNPETNWSTPFLGNNLAPKRVRFLATLGYYYPMRFHSDVWHGPKAEVPDAED